MDDIMIVILLLVVFFGVRYKFKEKPGDGLGVDNPYYDNVVNTPKTMSLDKYEKELNTIFDYDSVKTGLDTKTLDENVIENMNVDEEWEEEKRLILSDEKREFEENKIKKNK